MKLYCLFSLKCLWMDFHGPLESVEKYSFLKLRLFVWWQSPVLSLETQWLSQCKLILPVIRRIGRWDELLLSSLSSPFWHERTSELTVQPWKGQICIQILLRHSTNTSNLHLTLRQMDNYLTAGFDVVYSNPHCAINLNLVVCGIFSGKDCAHQSRKRSALSGLTVRMF